MYTLIAFIGLLGLIPLYWQHKRLLLPIVLFLSLIVYLVFSWWMWDYGWGFGCRPLIEALAVLAVPLAALFAWLRTKLGLFGKGVGIVLGAFCIWLNIYQTEQYKFGTLPGDNITKEYYWRVWNRMHIDDKDRDLLRK